MKNKEIKYLPFIVGYLGKSDYHEVAHYIQKPEVETFNALEKLVKKGKIKSEVIRGEIRYSSKVESRGEEQ